MRQILCDVLGKDAAPALMELYIQRERQTAIKISLKQRKSAFLMRAMVDG